MDLLWIETDQGGFGSSDLTGSTIVSARQKVSSLLSAAGIEIGGARPFDMQVHDERFYERVMAEGSLGAGGAAVQSPFFFTRPPPTRVREAKSAAA